MTCDDFETAIEMRLHGALGDAEATALDVHLVSCARCRTFEAGARGTEAAMRDAASEAARQVDWGELEAQVARWRRRGWVSVGPGAVTLIVWGAVAWKWHARGDPDAWVPLVAALAAVLALALAWRKRRADAARMARGGEELLGLLRRDLAARRRTLVPLLLLLAALTIGMAWRAAVEPGPWASGLLWSMAAAGGITVAAGVLVKRPRLAREQAVLDGLAGRETPAPP
jgi:hypothetical protein